MSARENARTAQPAFASGRRGVRDFRPRPRFAMIPIMWRRRFTTTGLALALAGGCGTAVETASEQTPVAAPPVASDRAASVEPEAGAITRTLHPTALCGAADEAAVRSRVAGIPACDRATGLLYAAASTGRGPLVVVRWDGIQGGARVRLGSDGTWLTSQMVPASPDDRAAIAVSILLAMDGLSRVALDLPSTEAMLEPAERPLLRHLGGDPLGVVRRDEHTHLTAMRVRNDVYDDGRRSRWIVRCEVDLQDDGLWTARSRSFSHLVDGREEHGLQPDFQPWPDAPVGCLDGL